MIVNRLTLALRIGIAARPCLNKPRYLPQPRAPGPAKRAVQENPRHLLPRVVLLEIPIKVQRNLFAHATDSTAVRAQLVKHAQRRLESRVGKRFKEVVLRCLNGDFGVDDDTREDMKLQQALRHQVLDVVEQAANSV